MERLPIGVGILSWKAPLTVAHTLEQYGGFPEFFREFKIFFQEVSPADRAVAEKAGVAYEGRPDNVGIQAGMRWVVENLTSEYILYLENDFNLTVPVADALQELGKALAWIRGGRVDMVRLRSRFNPGEPLIAPMKYSRVYRPVDIDPRFRLHSQLKKASMLVRLFRPYKALRAASRSFYVEREPERIFPRVFRREPEGLVTTSAYLNWTNNPVLIRRDLFLRLADRVDACPSRRLVGGFTDFEKALNCRWWRAQRFRIGLPEGIFTHNRLDR